MIKKILWLIFLFPLFLTTAKAETYYSDYTLVDEVLEESDMVRIDTLKKYRWYENVAGVEYQLYNGNESSDCYLEEGTWQSEQQDEIYLEEEIQYTYQYTLDKGARYIHLTDVYGSYDAFRITELEVYVNGSQIDYSFECVGCWDGFDEFIHNGIPDENESYIDNGGSLIIDLKKIYPANDIEVVFYIFDLGTDTKRYTLAFSSDKTNLYSVVSSALSFSDRHWSNALKITNTIASIAKNDWTTTVTTNTKNTSEFVVSEQIIDTKYRYNKKWCLYDVTNKVYIEGYHEESPKEGSIQSEEYIEEYLYHYRDKIEIQDDIVITSYEYDLSDYILYSSTDYVIEENININDNGNYLININVPYMNISKEIKVDIKDNTIKEQEETIGNLNDLIAKLKQEIENLQEQLDNLKEEYESKLNELKDCQECLLELEKEYSEKLSSLSNQINDLQTLLKTKQEEINSLESENENLKNINQEIEKLLDDSKKLNEEIIKEYNDKLKQLKDNNDAYYNKINELTDQINKLNQDIKLLIEHENELKNYYENKLIEKDNLVTNLTNETISLEEEITNLNKEFENLETSNVNSGYLLRISRKDIADNWYIILLILLLLLLLIYILKNKSNQNKF